ncbi:alkaline phosphatase D family protein [Fictibacillus terranigra]|uniref:Alkaline phosphatase D family protein n=1 Tax=Fictibacillus terranigra TaxID=3058424 RepID=A0ABT8E1G5_9BACL|nr:alkaline phosphatase D family protein [Fictibacillus sp. CENA-BCM004]MDN4071754.1 alkaline phosphatase D family protein [Fictibacillus sp. CENA-BCM004]
MMGYEEWLKDLSSKKLNRRTFLGSSGKAALATTLGLAVPVSLGNKGVEAAFTFDSYPFTLGVASGDPLPDSVVLWTRLAPNPASPDGLGGMKDRNIIVNWEIAEDEKFNKVVRHGKEVAMPELAHSVHAEVFGLKPGREYYYRFQSGNEVSPVGRTKTAPVTGSRLNRLSFAFASCQSWAGGRYAAYKDMAQQDLDFVMHLGDYIYEKKDTETLADFRNLHALYKSSPDLQAAHAKFPFICTFDDHEVENNWANQVSQPDGEASNEHFPAIRAAAFQAYYEHLPLRLRAKPHGSDMILYRHFNFGDLAEFSVLDTRQYRDDQLKDGFPGAPQDPEAWNPTRTMMGSTQEKWLLNNLQKSGARWNVIAQQTMMAQYDYDTGSGISVNHDQWDGYAGERARILDFIQQNRPSNPIVLAGDWHSGWVNDLKSDFNKPQSEILATEFVGTSISSGCGWKGAVEQALSVNPHVKFFNGDLRGYVRCHVTRDAWTSDYRAVPSASDVNAKPFTMSSWVVENGKAGAKEIGTSTYNKVRLPETIQ